MGYLEEFQKQISTRNFSKFLQLWEEYCTNDTADAEEFISLLKIIKKSEFATPFGQLIETALPLWSIVQEEKASYNILKYLIDLQTLNNSNLAEIAYNALEKAYGKDAEFKERIRLIGLRSRDNFQGALSNYDLLAHMAKGKFVFHTGGWGTAEITDISPLREQVTLECENVTGRKHLTFKNAFNALIPLEDDTFLARRFADPDKLEEQARKDPVGVIKLLLKDLGPLTASDIKDEMSELVIPENDWAKWWQSARGKLKKDTMVETPSSLKKPFRLRQEELTHESQLLKAIQKKTEFSDVLETAYTAIRDMPSILKDEVVKNSIKEKILTLLAGPGLTKEQELEIYLFLEEVFGHQPEEKTAEKIIRDHDNVEKIIHGIEIAAFKKHALQIVRKSIPKWVEIFLSMLFSVHPTSIRDYLLKELSASPEGKKALREKLTHLLQNPLEEPESFVWYFQKLIKQEKTDLPYHNKEGQNAFFDGFLVLLHKLEELPRYRDLSKKMYNILVGDRYAVVRYIFEGTDLDTVTEFLLLASKCQIFNDHDRKILRSLAGVVHSSLNQEKENQRSQINDNVVWTTSEGYRKTQERMKHISTVEMVDNAREIEEARSHGDLRENAEYKFAKERRASLQGELKSLASLINKARILTPEDIYQDEVGVGGTVELEDPEGNKVTYTILGPWEADPDLGILSFQSKLAQAMIGLRVGDAFQFRDNEYKVVGLKSYLQQS